MIDPQSGDRACAHQFKKQAVSRVEDFWQLHPDRGQIVYVKKAAVIDFLGRDPPEGEPIRLGVQQFVERVEAARVARLAVDLCAELFRSPVAPAALPRNDAPAAA